MTRSLGHSACIRYADITSPIVDSYLVNWQLQAFRLFGNARRKESEE
jgi:hypothetical protein